MNEKVFSIDEFKKVLDELFDAEKLNNDTDLAFYIKDSIDLGELVAILNERYNVKPINIDRFKEETLLIEVFKNFK